MLARSHSGWITRRHHQSTANLHEGPRDLEKRKDLGPIRTETNGSVNPFTAILRARTDRLSFESQAVRVRNMECSAALDDRKEGTDDEQRGPDQLRDHVMHPF